MPADANTPTQEQQQQQQQQQRGIMEQRRRQQQEEDAAVLGCLQQARRLIVEENRGQVEGLDQSFPIVDAAGPHAPRWATRKHAPHLHGWTDSAAGERRGPGGRRGAVQRVGIALRDKSGRRVPVELALFTLVHELAHTVTGPEWLRRCDVEDAVMRLQVSDAPVCPKVGGGRGAGGDRGRQDESLVCISHGPAFYHNFAALLRIAERAGVYALPCTANKLSPKNLRRMDSIDVAASQNRCNLGHSRLFSADFFVAATPAGELTHRGGHAHEAERVLASGPAGAPAIQITLTDDQRSASKVVVVKHSELGVSGLIKAAKNKLCKKAPRGDWQLVLAAEGGVAEQELLHDASLRAALRSLRTATIIARRAPKQAPQRRPQAIKKID